MKQHKHTTKHIFFYICFNFLAFSLSFWLPNRCYGQPDGEIKRLARFSIGTTVDAKKLLTDTELQKVILAQFNSITLSNAMQWVALQPTEEELNTNLVDSVAAFCEAHTIRLHGHALVDLSDPKALPAYITNFKGDSTALEFLLKRHIQYVASHFQGKVDSYDVVEGYFTDSGTVRQNIFSRVLGKDYIYRCFDYASAVDGKAKLFYTDSDLEKYEAKLQAVIAFAKECKKRGIPLDGLGLDLQTTLATNMEGITRLMQQITKPALLVNISALAVAIAPEDIAPSAGTAFKAKAQALSDSLANRQRMRYTQIVRTYNQTPPKQLFGITIVGTTDADSHLLGYEQTQTASSVSNQKASSVSKNLTQNKVQQNFPTLLDASYHPKPAYKGVVLGLMR